MVLAPVMDAFAPGAVRPQLAARAVDSMRLAVLVALEDELLVAGTMDQVRDSLVHSLHVQVLHLLE